VVGHSLGGLAAAAVAGSGGFTRRLLLIDPVFEIPDAEFEDVVAEQVAEVAGAPDAASFARANPRWHAEDAALKAAAAAATSAFVVERCLRDNSPWHFLDLARSLAVPTTILAADPAAGAMFTPDLTAENPLVTARVVAGAGHNVHRDDPDAVLASV
jgi:pimeloyl-ACP methyl ester carboxylesterase